MFARFKTIRDNFVMRFSLKINPPSKRQRDACRTAGSCNSIRLDIFNVINLRMFEKKHFDIGF